MKHLIDALFVCVIMVAIITICVLVIAGEIALVVMFFRWLGVF